MKPYSFVIFFILLTLTELVELIALQHQRVSTPDDNLLPLKRQKKAVQEDLALLFPESRSLFRERQSHRPFEYVDDPDVLGAVKQSLSSAFSERRHMIEDREKFSKNRKKMLAEKKAKRDDDQWAYAIQQQQQEHQKPNHQHKRKNLDPRNWDPRFPGLNLPTKRRGLDDQHDTEDRERLLQRLAYNSMNKRLLLLDGDSGPVVDRGERRRRIEKRTSAVVKAPAINKEELDRILADDHPDTNKSRDSFMTTPKMTSEVSATHSHGMKSLASFSKEEEPFKGKEWVPPTDSDRTLRSKKAWDDYFGVDKRSSGSGPEMNDHIESGVAGHEEVKDEDLKDVLVRWYFDKMLKHMTEREPDPNGDTGRDPRPNEEDEEMEEAKRDWKVENEEVPLKAVEERLKKIEDVILLKAIRLLEEQIDEDNGEVEGGDVDLQQKENYFLEHLKAAYSLEKMRNDLQEFEDSLIKLKFLGEKEEEEDEKMKKKRKMFLTDDEEEVEDDGDDKKRMKKNNGHEIKSEFVAKGSAEVVPPLTLYGEDQDDYANPGDQPSVPCPVLTEAINYCDDLGQALGDVGLALTRSCVEHMLCYTCEGSSSSCDTLFLRRAMSLCSEDFRCQAMAGAMRSVFLSNHDDFRRRHRAFCVQDQCLAKLVSHRRK